jgi:hypothetical protein
MASQVTQIAIHLSLAAFPFDRHSKDSVARLLDDPRQRRFEILPTSDYTQMVYLYKGLDLYAFKNSRAADIDVYDMKRAVDVRGHFARSGRRACEVYQRLKQPEQSQSSFARALALREELVQQSPE